MRKSGLDLGPILRKGEIVPYLYPICDVKKFRVVAAEVVPREKDGRNTFGPQFFMYRVEMLGVSDKLDLFMLESACELLNQWKASGLKLFVAQHWETLLMPEYLQRIMDLIERYEITPANLVIEITGSTENLDEKMAVVSEIRKAGVLVAIEHFGVGGASLDMLIKTQAEFIKLDESLLNMDHTQWSEAVLKNLSDLARLIKISLICENVAKPAQSAMLRRIDCQLIQGIRTGRAMTPKRFRNFQIEWEKRGNYREL